jgi:hypothetical protein
VIDEISQVDAVKKFSILYLDNYLNLWVCDMNMKTFHRIPMSAEQMETIHEETERCVTTDFRQIQRPESDV